VKRWDGSEANRDIADFTLSLLTAVRMPTYPEDQLERPFW
jgi:hypothetical protein